MAMKDQMIFCTRSIILALAMAYSTGCGLTSNAPEIPISAHFDGERFNNDPPTTSHLYRDFLKWYTHRDMGQWHLPCAPLGPPPADRVDDLRVTVVGHSTVLIQMNGLNILTDPIWSKRAGPNGSVGVKRACAPAIRFDDLPPIDLVLISHNHYDHLDMPTIRKLVAAHHPRFIVGAGVGPLVSGDSQTVSELDWWERVEIPTNRTVRAAAKDFQGSLQVYFVPAQHWSNRYLADARQSLWGGFVIEGAAGVVYFAGDTAMGPHFGAIASRFGPPRLAIIPVGAFKPRWFMHTMHIGPDEALAVHTMLNARTSLAIHYGTFPLGDDGQEEPITLLRAAMAAQHIPEERFWALPFGQGRDVP
jgi:L-ascorbate metabolism protein UlaG (beta-lactamase superfamily)